MKQKQLKWLNPSPLFGQGLARLWQAADRPWAAGLNIACRVTVHLYWHWRFESFDRQFLHPAKIDAAKSGMHAHDDSRKIDTRLNRPTAGKADAIKITIAGAGLRRELQAKGIAIHIENDAG